MTSEVDTTMEEGTPKRPVPEERQHRTMTQSYRGEDQRDSSSSSSVTIIGAGFAGLCTALTLLKAGIGPLVIFDKADEVGGVWSSNTYPGLSSDVPAWVYSLSFDDDMDWSRFAAPGNEVKSYLKSLVSKYRLVERGMLRLGTQVVESRWQEKEQRWESVVQHADGACSVHRSRYLVVSVGRMGRPTVPVCATEGLGTFKGASFHTARWDHGVSLEGKRVAVVGTGASAAQVIASLAPTVSCLVVVQRTAAWVLPKVDFPLPAVVRLLLHVWVVRWCLRRAISNLMEVLGLPYTAPGTQLSRWVARRREKEALGQLHKAVRDVKLREALTPKDTMGCKAVVFCSDYYKAMARENVTLVTGTVDRLTSEGFVDSEGCQHVVDVIVWATGFDAGTPWNEVRVVGRNGRTWDDHMRCRTGGGDGDHGNSTSSSSSGKKGQMVAYLGTVAPGLPNLFMLHGPNTSLGHHSIVALFEAQAQLIVKVILKMRAVGATSAEVKADLCEEYGREMRERLAKSVWVSGGCTDVSGRKESDRMWPGSTTEFIRRARRVDLSSFNLGYRGGSTDEMLRWKRGPHGDLSSWWKALWRQRGKQEEESGGNDSA